MIEDEWDDLNRQILPLSGEEGTEYTIHVRFRVSDASVAYEIAGDIQENLVAAGVSVWSTVPAPGYEA